MGISHACAVHQIHNQTPWEALCQGTKSIQHLQRAWARTDRQLQYAHDVTVGMCENYFGFNGVDTRGDLLDILALKNTGCVDTR